MSEGTIIDIARQSLTTVLMMVLPILIVALVVGLLISIFQAMTQIQEQTLSFIPKIVAVFVSILIFGPYMLTTAKDFTVNLFQNLVNYIP